MYTRSTTTTILKYHIVDLKSKLRTLEDRIEEATAEHARGEFEAWKRQEQIRTKEGLAEKR